MTSPPLHRIGDAHANPRLQKCGTRGGGLAAEPSDTSYLILSELSLKASKHDQYDDKQGMPRRSPFSIARAGEASRRIAAGFMVLQRKTLPLLCHAFPSELDFCVCVFCRSWPARERTADMLKNQEKLIAMG